ncbi:hypothetical protein GC173_05090 [bacterium]|nr:hypothetical protein [bacterium]
MMKVGIYGLLIGALASSASAAVVAQFDFAPGEINTLPAALTASYDPGVDVIVVANTTHAPAVPADHAGGDGHSLRVGDLGPTGGGYDWAFPATQPSLGNVSVSAYFYMDWETVDTTPGERDYLVMARLQNADPQVTGSAAGTRQGYFLAVTQDSSWTGISPNPTAKRAFLMKKVAGTHTVIGSESTVDIPTGWHKLELRVVGNNLVGLVDDVVVCSGTDAGSSYATGGWAVGYYDDNIGAGPDPAYAAAIDNVVVDDAPSSVNDWTAY